MSDKKLRIGVWLTNNYKPSIGGGFGYYEKIINELKLIKHDKFELIFISYKIDKSFFENNLTYTINRKTPFIFISLGFNFILNFFIKHVLKISGLSLKSNFSYVDKEITSQLKSVIDIIYYPIPLAYDQLLNFPFIYTAWDLGHLTTYPFPELSMNGVFENRHNDHISILNKAIFVCTESQYGKKQLIEKFNLNEGKIKIIPLFPSAIIASSINTIKPKYLQESDFFVHYPAQFWAHKNHYNLLFAIKKLVKKYSHLKLILSGSDKGNLKYILSLIKELNLEQNVIYLGFISNNELKWLYLNSQGLVMPTFLGPTNMPLLEAAYLNCKVACTDMPGHREQLGDYAFYFNPANPENIASCIENMILKDKLNINFQSQFNIQNAVNNLVKCFEDVIPIRRCWGDYDKIF